MPTSLDFIAKNGMAPINRLYGVYPAMVMDNADPTNRGILTVKLVGTAVAPEVKLEAQPLNIGGGRGYGIKWPLPPRGSMVALVFGNDGDAANPYWAYMGWAKGEAPVEFSKKGTCGVITQMFNHILITQDENGVESLDIKFDGPVNITSSTEVNITSPCNALEPSEGGYNSLGTGDNDGFAIASKLTDRLNILVKEIENLKRELSLHTHVCSSPSSPSSPPVVPLTTPITPFESILYVDTNNIS